MYLQVRLEDVQIDLAPMDRNDSGPLAIASDDRSRWTRGERTIGGHWLPKQHMGTFM